MLLATGDFIGNPDKCWALLNECQEMGRSALELQKRQFGADRPAQRPGHKMAAGRVP